MIKLAKIMGAGNNVPEPVKFPIDGIRSYQKGTLFFAVNGTLTTTYSDKTDRKFVLLESIPENSGRDFIWGYYVTDNMVFEIDLCYPEYYPVGQSLAYHESEPEEGIGRADNAEGSDLLVIEDNNSATSGKVIAVFKW